MSHGEPSDTEISSLADKDFKPNYFDPDDADVQSGDRPSTSSSTRSRSDRTPRSSSRTHKRDQSRIFNKKKTDKDTTHKKKKTRWTGASSSGLYPEERAHSLLLPTTDEAADSVPRERSQGQDPEDEGQADADSLPSAIVYASFFICG